MSSPGSSISHKTQVRCDSTSRWGVTEIVVPIREYVQIQSVGAARSSYYSRRRKFYHSTIPYSNEMMWAGRSWPAIEWRRRVNAIVKAVVGNGSLWIAEIGLRTGVCCSMFRSDLHDWEVVVWSREPTQSASLCVAVVWNFSVGMGEYMSLFDLILSIARTHLDLHQIATRSMIQRSSCDEDKSERLNQLLSGSWGAVAMAQNFANQ